MGCTPIEQLTDDHPRDECGVFGIYAPDEDVATLTYFGLYALQHRGQESAGIAVSNGKRIVVHKDMGLVNQVFDTSSLAAMSGHLAVGHVRYSTAGSSTWPNAQPQHAECEIDGGDGVALGHNGNLVNTTELSLRIGATKTNDSWIMTQMLAQHPSGDLRTALIECAADWKGAFSVVVIDENRLHAARDPQGVRPLVIGQLPGGGWVVASETSALDIVGATRLRSVDPGEVITITDEGIESARFAPANRSFCLFEWVYLARPDHTQGGSSVSAARRRMGERLAAESPVDADLVIGVPDSGIPAAAGFGAAAGLPVAEGLVKNRYVGRTFIQPTDSLRKLGIRLKLSPVREVIDGQRLVVVDDSIVRGNTSRQLVEMLRQAGAAEVHLRITSPPIIGPCFYGIDMASSSQLIGAEKTVAEICDFIGADSLHYISLDGLIGTVPESKDQLCRACMDGEYPIDVSSEHADRVAVSTKVDA